MLVRENLLLSKSAISTVEQTLILKKLGKLSARDLISLERAMKELLDLKT